MSGILHFYRDSSPGSRPGAKAPGFVFVIPLLVVVLAFSGCIRTIIKCPKVDLACDHFTCADLTVDECWDIWKDCQTIHEMVRETNNHIGWDDDSMDGLAEETARKVDCALEGRHCK